MQRIAPLTRFGRPLQEQRRMMQRILSQRVVRSYESIQRREINAMIRSILCSPEQFIDHIKRYVPNRRINYDQNFIDVL